MKHREKLLAILAVAAILLSQGMPVYSHFFVEPVEARRGDIARLEEEVAQRERTDRSVRRARTNLTKWKTASLPPDWRNAQRLYLEWLTDLAKMTGFSDLKVTPAPSLREGKVFTPVRVSLDAKVGYDQLCRFLDRFQKADILHRISEMHVKKEEGGGGGKLVVTLVAESLALASAEKRDYLLPHTTVKDELKADGTTLTVGGAELFPTKNEFLARSGNEILRVKAVDGPSWTVERAAESTKADSHLAGSTIELFHVVSKSKSKDATAVAVDAVIKHNLFVKPDSQGKPQDPFESEYAKNTYLRMLWQGEQWEGWLYDPSNDKTILHQGSTFQIAELTATVVEINALHMVVEVGAEKKQLRLGANLQSMGKGGDKGPRDGGRGRGPDGSVQPGGSSDGPRSNDGPRRERGGGGGGRRGRGRPDMSDPAVREKMMERFKKFRESQGKGELGDFGDFGGEGGAESSNGKATENATPQPDTAKSDESKASSAPAEK